MRIYANANSSNYAFSETIKPKLAAYFVEVRHINNLWTPDGLFQIDNDKLFRVEIKDVPVVKTLLGAYPVTIDGSEFSRVGEEWYQVPPETHPELIIQKVYKASASASSTASVSTAANMKLEWIFEYDSSGEVLRDNYFYLPPNEDMHASENKADLMKFLNL
jgi:hypothetical protein